MNQMITSLVKNYCCVAFSIFALLFKPTIDFAQSKDVILVFRHCEYDLVSYNTKYFSVLDKDSMSLSYEKMDQGTYQIHVKSYGQHTLQYSNIFGQKILKTLAIDSITKSLAICVDEFVDTDQKTFIEALTTSDKLEIQYYWPCCDINEKALFYLKDGFYFGELYKGKKKRKKSKLTTEQVQFLIDFEKKLNFIQNASHNCDIKECYNLYYNGNLELRHFDESCDWSGFAKLKKIIFGKEDL